MPYSQELKSTLLFALTPSSWHSHKMSSKCTCGPAGESHTELPCFYNWKKNQDLGAFMKLFCVLHEGWIQEDKKGFFNLRIKINNTPNFSTHCRFCIPTTGCFHFFTWRQTWKQSHSSKPSFLHQPSAMARSL